MRHTVGTQVRRQQTLHEKLIPLLVKGIGIESYLEFGVNDNQTISRVKCKRKFGVDHKVKELKGAKMFAMSTSEFIRKHAASFAPYDMVFIDSDHKPLSVLDDFYGIWPHVTPDGLILLHDTNPQTAKDTRPGFCDEAWKAAREIARSYESVTLPYCPGITIVRKRKLWGPE